MSEQQQLNETQPPVNDELTERVNNSYLANDCTLLRGGSDIVVIIKGDKDGESVDIFMTLDDMEEMVVALREEENRHSK